MKSLKSRCSAVRALCWAESTWKCRKSQWKKFLDFCQLYKLVPVPATVETVCLYITYLCDCLAYSSICNYLSAVWSLHEMVGYTPVAKGDFLIRCTLRGARRLLGDSVLSADPLLPSDLMDIYKVLNFKSLKDLVFWAALCLAHRCLLRKGHFTASPHTLLRQDVEFTDYGLKVTIRSSKTIQFREREVVIPIVASSKSLLCPVRWLKKYLLFVYVAPLSPLFVNPNTQKPLLYNKFSARLKRAVKDAKIKGNITSHSIRRGSATYLSRIGMPLHDTKVCGDWRSLSVLLYLSGDLQTRLIKDVQIAKSLEQFKF